MIPVDIFRHKEVKVDRIVPLRLELCFYVGRCLNPLTSWMMSSVRFQPSLLSLIGTYPSVKPCSEYISCLLNHGDENKLKEWMGNKFTFGRRVSNLVLKWRITATSSKCFNAHTARVKSSYKTDSFTQSKAFKMKINDRKKIKRIIWKG